MTAPLKLTAKTADVGGIPVARVLPQAKKRTIGAWCFLDHAGPSIFAEGEPGLQVGSHPHTHLQTFTWMLAGEVLHQDSLGNKILIRSKQVNLMTAGTGICHTEQTPPESRKLHAVQLWIALPKNQTIAPAFQHYPKLPEWQDSGADYILTTGSFDGRTAPTLQYSPIVGVDIRYRNGGSHYHPLNPDFEYGILVIQGRLNIGNESFGPNDLAYLPTGTNDIGLAAEADTHIMLIGGKPLDFEPVIWWNFVAAERAEIERATAEWNAHSKRFGSIDTELQRLNAPEVPWAKQK
ncbi:pirin family protein [Uruburuella testudinis]|uniref:Pirin family protein n=1 Tax=Uruburuella testudinis TaxID=1282863 RepID=A0ABY4DP49_9NEIS|nr:pirin family protein [Uruburuella testudinis]UOO80838.1 pirin family protein [Uruburuella testudinis]